MTLIVPIVLPQAAFTTWLLRVTNFLHETDAVRETAALHALVDLRQTNTLRATSAET